MKIKDSGIYLSEEEFEKVYEQDPLNIVDFYNNHKLVYEDIVKLVLDNQEAFRYVDSKNNNYDNTIRVFFYKDYVDDKGNTVSDSTNAFNFTLTDLANSFEKIKLTPKQEEKANYIKNKINIKGKLENYIKGEYVITLDNKKKIKIPTRELIKYITLDDGEFAKLAMQQKYCGYTRKEYAYALRCFLNKECLTKSAYFNPTENERLANLFNYKFSDYQSLEFKEIERDDLLLNSVSVNPLLFKKVTEDIPHDYDSLEKSIHVYIKLCQLFTYDESFYVDDPSGVVRLHHGDLGKLPRIVGKRDDIVCYEFNALYAKILDQMGIYVKTITDSRFGDPYGFGHAYLEYVADDYIVRADSVTSILEGDLVNAKIGADLTGLHSLNRCSSTYHSFIDKMEKVYQDIKHKQTESLSMAETKSLIGMLDKTAKYRKIYHEPVLKDKIDLFLQEIEDSKLKKIDAAGYMLALSRAVFSIEERKNKIKAVMVKENGDSLYAKLRVIILYNENGIDNDKESNKYLYIAPGVKVESVTKEELQSMLDKKIIEEMAWHKIPGLDHNNDKEGNRNAR